MVFNDQTQKWEPEPVEDPAPGKGESTEKQEKTEKGIKLKRRSEVEGEEPQSEERKHHKWFGGCEASGVEASN